MGSLRSALDELRLDDVRAMAGDVLVRDLDELEHASRVIEAERARRLHEVERRRTYALDGHLSPTTWMADRFGVSRSSAAASVRVARAVAEMPLVREPPADGEASTSAVAALMAAREASPEAYARDEGLLVDAARAVSVAELRTVVAYWRQRVDAGRAAVDEEIRYERRALYVAVARRDGPRGRDLDAETGRVLMTALPAVCDAEGAGARRGPGSPVAGAAAGGCARRGVPTVARLTDEADGRRRAAAPRRHDGPGVAGGASRPAVRAHRRGCHHGRGGSTAHVRRGRQARDRGCALGAARRGSADGGRPATAPSSRDRPGRRQPVSRLRAAAGMARRASRGALG